MLNTEILNCFYIVKNNNAGRIKNMLHSREWIDDVSNEVLLLLHLKNDYSDIKNLKAFIETLFFRTTNTFYKKNRTINKYCKTGLEDLNNINVPAADYNYEQDLIDTKNLEHITSCVTQDELKRWHFNHLVSKCDPNSLRNKVIAIRDKYKSGEIKNLKLHLNDNNISYDSYKQCLRRVSVD